jgi:hypothetical protein
MITVPIRREGALTSLEEQLHTMITIKTTSIEFFPYLQ